MLAMGKSARQTLDKLTGEDPGRDTRQVGIVDAQGNAASFTGSKCNDWAGHIEGDHFAVQGNILASEEVVKAMAEAYKNARGRDGSELADWLVAALETGQQAGGDKRGRQSAALLVVRDKGGYDRKNDRYIDLRVEDHGEPIQELARLLKIHKDFYADAHRDKPHSEAK
jgi:uncharacterized Ntn-hydrolase superfamily protein